MRVEEKRGGMGREAALGDQFPVGMRVLAVDDDPTCLKLLEGLLRRCQYHVTTTGQAITALKLLRENKNKFDLVISDVHMPDMDGFKLLELVGLEMDLPVIMLSANGETSAVMNGITYGACDYLLKPVRIEELKNIWQHVVRRRKFEPKDQNNFDNGDQNNFDSGDQNNFDNGDDYEKRDAANAEGGQGAVTSGSADPDGKTNKKRKDQNEDEEDDFSDNGNENEDPSAQKKARVVWSVELHRKFVAAVNQLGINKAVPRRILDLMNVEKLTRENVASHLQKYRLYLKRLSDVANQQASMAAALGSRDPCYLSMGSFNSFGNSHSPVGSGQLPAFPSFQPNGILSRLNYTNGFGLGSLASSQMVQFGSQNNIGQSITDITGLQQASLHGNQHGNALQGLPSSLGLDQLQQHKVPQGVNRCVSGAFSGNEIASVNSNKSFINIANRPLLLQSQQQLTQSRGLDNQFSVNMPSLSSSDPFHMTAGSSQLCDVTRCNETWQGAVPLTRHLTSNLPSVAPFGSGDSGPSNMAGNVTYIASHMNGNLHGASSRSVAAGNVHGPPIGTAVQVQASSVGGDMMLTPTGSVEFSKFVDLRSCKNESPDDYGCKLDLLATSPISSSLQDPSIFGHIAEGQRMSSDLLNSQMKMDMFERVNFGTPFFTQPNGNDKSTSDVHLKEEYVLDSSKLQGGFSPKDCILDDLVNSVMKPNRDDNTLMDGNIRCDMYALDACL